MTTMGDLRRFVESHRFLTNECPVEVRLTAYDPRIETYKTVSCEPILLLQPGYRLSGGEGRLELTVELQSLFKDGVKE